MLSLISYSFDGPFCLKVAASKSEHNYVCVRIEDGGGDYILTMIKNGDISRLNAACEAFNRVMAGELEAAE